MQIPLEPDERIRAIPGYPGYFATTEGRIISARNPKRTRLLHPYVATKRGYLAVGLCLSGGRKQSRLVHQLVLETFVEKRPEGMVACHNDGNPANNRLANLRWDTSKGNEADKKLHGRNPSGERNPQAKLIAEDVLKIRQLASTGRTQKSLAEQFGVSFQAISKILRGQRWGHLEGQSHGSHSSL